jgi:type IV pilus assembly protein PilA
MLSPRRDHQGFTLIELLIVVAIIGIIAAIAVPMLMRARISGNEASAISSIRAIVTAQADFRASNNGFAPDLDKLGAPCPGGMVGFISPDLGANEIVKSGYQFDVVEGESAVAAPNDCHGDETITDYYGTAVPVSVGSTGIRAFATNGVGMIWQASDGVPPSQPFERSGTVAPLGR